MLRLSRFLFVIWVCLSYGPVLLQAQQAEPPHYIYVAQWAIPRAQWNTYAAGWEKDNKPVLERMAANGTLVSWGAFETVVHTPDGITHGVWWSGNSVAALERVRDELLKVPPSPALNAATHHHDLLLRTLIQKNKTVAASGGYLYVANYTVQPGKGRQWRELWERYDKPLLEDQFAKGNLVYYGVDVEDIHTQTPGLRSVVMIAPNAEALDRVNAAFAAQDRTAIGAAFAEVLVPGSHRDSFTRIRSWWHK